MVVRCLVVLLLGCLFHRDHSRSAHTPMLYQSILCCQKSEVMRSEAVRENGDGGGHCPFASN